MIARTGETVSFTIDTDNNVRRCRGTFRGIREDGRLVFVDVLETLKGNSHSCRKVVEELMEVDPRNMSFHIVDTGHVA